MKQGTASGKPQQLPGLVTDASTTRVIDRGADGFGKDTGPQLGLQLPLGPQLGSTQRSGLVLVGL
ncbi:unnamed protein product, partial [Gadus morhua 'NCC']